MTWIKGFAELVWFLFFFSLIWNLMFTTRCCLFFFCEFFYRFPHTYAQLIGFSDMHPLSVKGRPFDTFQLLLPFNGPIKLFHSYPFDQSDATSIQMHLHVYIFFSFHFSTGECLSIFIGNMFFRLCIWTVDICD